MRSFILTAIVSACVVSSLPSVINQLALNRFGMNVSNPGFTDQTGMYADVAKHTCQIYPVTGGNGARCSWPALPFEVINGRPSVDFYWSCLTQYTPTVEWSGVYKMYFQGTASLFTGSAGASISNIVYDPGLDETSADVTVLGNLEIRFTNLGSTFDIRKLQLIRPGCTRTQLLSTHFELLLQRASRLRFMDYFRTNLSVVQDWVVPEKNILGLVSWYDAVEMCNVYNKDMWACLPLSASDSYINSLAIYLRDNLSSNRKITLEHANEVWNFGAGFYAYHQTRQKMQDTAECLSPGTKIFSNFHQGPLPNETSICIETAIKSAQAIIKVRRVNNEQFVKHTGVFPFRNGERYLVTYTGSYPTTGPTVGLWPVTGQYITITVLSPTEFKFDMQGADVAELPCGYFPNLTHTPIISVNKVAGLVTVEHDGSRTIPSSVCVDGLGSYTGLQSKVSGTTTLSAVSTTVVSPTVFIYTTPVAGTDLANSTVFSEGSALIVYLNPSNRYLVGMNAGSGAGVFAVRWLAERTKFISDTFRSVFGETRFQSQVQPCLSTQLGGYSSDTAVAMRSALSWIELTTGKKPDEYLKQIAHAPYFGWENTLQNCTDIRSDTSGLVGAQKLLGRIEVQQGEAIRSLGAYAKRYNLLPCFYEAGVDTMTLGLGDGATGVPPGYREATQHNPLMKDVIRDSIEFGDRCGIEGIQMHYSGVLSYRMSSNALAPNGSGTVPTANTWHLAEGTSTLKPIGELSSDGYNWKLQGVDQYLTSPQVLPGSSGSGGIYINGPGYLVYSSINASLGTYLFMDTYCVPSPITLTSTAKVTSSYSSGGHLFTAFGSVQEGFYKFSITFAGLVPSLSQGSVVYSMKCRNDYPQQKFQLYINEVYQSEVINPARVTPTEYNTTASFTDVIIPCTFQKGINNITLVYDSPQSQSTHFVIQSIRITS